MYAVPIRIPFWPIIPSTLAVRRLLCSEHSLHISKASFVISNVKMSKIAQKFKQGRNFFLLKPAIRVTSTAPEGTPLNRRATSEKQDTFPICHCLFLVGTNVLSVKGKVLWCFSHNAFCLVAELGQNFNFEAQRCYWARFLSRKTPTFGRKMHLRVRIFRALSGIHRGTACNLSSFLFRQKQDVVDLRTIVRCGEYYRTWTNLAI